VELHMSYTHLSQDERYQIQHLCGGGFSAREIGAQLERAATTISRELRRNQGDADKYHAHAARRQSAKRRHATSAQARILPEQWVAVEARLMAEQWSPVQIASAASISHERIYQHIAADRQRGGKLWLHLRCRKQRRRHRCGTPRQRQRFHGRRIAERPAIVESLKRAGDGERDTIVGNGLARVVTLVDRKSGLLQMRRVPNGEADTVMRAIVHALQPLQARVHTLTWDNGSEFAEHALVDIALHARSYFAGRIQRRRAGSTLHAPFAIAVFFGRNRRRVRFQLTQRHSIPSNARRIGRRRKGRSWASSSRPTGSIHSPRKGRILKMPAATRMRPAGIRTQREEGSRSQCRHRRIWPGKCCSMRSS
jgi:IS30 family transposase